MMTERQIPAGYYQAYNDGLTAIYHKDEEKPIALVFLGKAKKPAFHVRYKNGEDRAAFNKKTIENQKQRQAILAEQKAERTKPHTLQVGDVMYCSWGWEQTNVDFYLVTETTKHGVTLQEIGHHSVKQTGWASDEVIPDKETLVKEPFKKKVNGYNHATLSSYQTLRKFDGAPLHRSWYA